MMTNVMRARVLLDQAESAHETSEEKGGNAYYRSLSERCYSQAAIYAAVAQAEALTRLAEVAEELLMAGELDRTAVSGFYQEEGRNHDVGGTARPDSE